MRAQRDAELLRQAEPQDLIKFGLIPEFVGRLPVMGVLDELDEAALIEILTKPRNAILKQYQRLFDYESVHLRFSEDAIRAIAVKLEPQGRRARTAHDPRRADARPDVPPARQQEDQGLGSHRRDGAEARSFPASAGESGLSKIAFRFRQSTVCESTIRIVDAVLIARHFCELSSDSQFCQSLRRVPTSRCSLHRCDRNRRYGSSNERTKRKDTVTNPKRPATGTIFGSCP